MSNLSNIQYNAEGGFCEGGGAGSLETVAGRVDRLSDSALLCVRFVSWVHCGGWTGWSPPRGSNRPPCLVCMSAFPFSLRGISLSSPPPPSNQTPWMLHWSRKNNQLPFCFSSHLNRTKKTYGNEALSCVVQTVGVMWFAFQWCGAVQLQLPAANRGLQPADRAPAHSNAQVLLLLLLLLLPKHTAPTFSTCSLIIHGENK